MPLLALIKPAVPAVRARVGSHALRAIVIASGCAAAPACRALAGRLSCASQLWRNIQMLVAAGPMLAADCWPALVHVHRGQLHRDARDHRDPAQLALHALLHPQDLWWRAVMTLISALHLTYAGFTFGQLGLQLENGLVEIFLSMCGTLVLASCGLGEPRQQAGCVAVAVLLAEWRARPSPPQSPRLHSNPSLTLALAFPS